MLGVTLLVIIVWTKAKKTYCTYCSEAKDQTSIFVISCLEDIFTTVDLAKYKTLVLYSDIGPHFLSTHSLDYFLLYHLVDAQCIRCQVRFLFRRDMATAFATLTAAGPKSGSTLLSKNA